MGGGETSWADGPEPTAEPQLTLLFDGAATPLLYLCEALPGTPTSAAKWRIQRIDTTLGVVILWADGDPNFDNVADNRGSLSYA